MNPLEKFIFKLENYWENEIELKRNEFLVHQNENFYWKQMLEYTLQYQTELKGTVFF